MVDRAPDFFPERVNMRVASMNGLGGVAENASRLYRVELGTPSTLASTGVTTNGGTLATAAQTLTSGFPYTLADKWGRCISISANGTGANAVGTMGGRDYLGQRMTEVFTFVSTTAQTGGKAFKYLDYFITGSNANATDVVRIGTVDKFGLPYKAVAIVGSLMNGLSSGAHTLNAPDETDPQTAADSDPRGTLTLSTAANGTRTFAALVALANANLHGVASV